MDCVVNRLDYWRSARPTNLPRPFEDSQPPRREAERVGLVCPCGWDQEASQCRNHRSMCALSCQVDNAYGFGCSSSVLSPIESRNAFVELHRQWRSSILVGHDLDVRRLVALRDYLESLIELSTRGDASCKPVVASKCIWQLRIAPLRYVVVFVFGVSTEQTLDQVA